MTRVMNGAHDAADKAVGHAQRWSTKRSTIGEMPGRCRMTHTCNQSQVLYPYETPIRDFDCDILMLYD